MLLLALIACGEKGSDAPPVSVDESCRTLDFGYTDPSDDAMAALERTNCYRRVMGLAEAVLEPSLDIAAQNHAEYMALNGELSHEEDRDAEGYTGQWVWDRAENAGYDWPNNTLMSEVVSFGYGPAAAVDGWMNSVYHRIPFTSPEIRETGFGQQDRYSSMAFVTGYTLDEGQAVLYPVDGQYDVPLRFNSDEEVPDPAPDASYVGPPITVTVGGTTAPGTDTNPFVLVLRGASLSGPSGEVELITLTPDTDPYLYQAVALLPAEPLEPGATYEVEVEVSWAGGEDTLYAAFETVSE